jgi:hypothetical protein
MNKIPKTSGNRNSTGKQGVLSRELGNLISAEAAELREVLEMQRAGIKTDQDYMYQDIIDGAYHNHIKEGADPVFVANVQSMLSNATEQKRHSRTCLKKGLQRLRKRSPELFPSVNTTTNKTYEKIKPLDLTDKIRNKQRLQDKKD